MGKKARVYDGTAWQELASAQTDLTAYSTTAQTTAGFRNAIINGDFRIWQRGTSFSSPTNGTFVSDRWVAYFDGTGATRTISQQAFTLGAAPVAGYEGQFFLRCNQSVAGTGGTFNEYNQKIESVRTFAGQTVTVSFWAKAASTTVLPSIVLRQEFGTGGSPSASVNTTVASSISVETSWTRFTYTITLPSLSGKTIGTSGTDNLTFILMLPLNATFTVDIWGVQVEKGSIATPFEQRPIGTELALCQRYYYRTGGTAFGPLGMASTQSSTAGRLHVNLPVQMRIAPTAIGTYGTAFGSSLGTLSSITFDRSTTTQLMLSVAGTSWTAGGSLSVYGSGDATSFLDVSAEL